MSVIRLTWWSELPLAEAMGGTCDNGMNKIRVAHHIQSYGHNILSLRDTNETYTEGEDEELMQNLLHQSQAVLSFLDTRCIRSLQHNK